jgi:hypothetical protein
LDARGVLLGVDVRGAGDDARARVLIGPSNGTLRLDV